MVISAPEVVKKSIGDEAAEAMGRWFGDILEHNAVSRDEFRPILTRLEVLERDVSELKQDMKEFRQEMNARFDHMNEQFNARFDRMNEQFIARFDSMNEQFTARFDSMNARYDGMNTRFDQMYDRIGAMMKWTVGTVGLFGTLITILLAISQFMK